jgi:hypothetical protein
MTEVPHTFSQSCGGGGKPYISLYIYLHPQRTSVHNLSLN